MARNGPRDDTVRNEWPGMVQEMKPSGMNGQVVAVVVANDASGSDPGDDISILFLAPKHTPCLR